MSNAQTSKSELAKKVDPIKLEEELDRIESKLREEETVDPILIVAGDPPLYTDKIPDEWNNICYLEDTHLDVNIAVFKPRLWKEKEDGTLVLHDGTQGNERYPEHEPEFEFEISPGSYVKYRRIDPQRNNQQKVEIPRETAKFILNNLETRYKSLVDRGDHKRYPKYLARFERHTQEVEESVENANYINKSLQGDEVRFDPQELEDVEIEVRPNGTVFVDGYDEDGNHWVDTYRHKRSERLSD